MQRPRPQPFRPTTPTSHTSASSSAQRSGARTSRYGRRRRCGKGGAATGSLARRTVSSSACGVVLRVIVLRRAAVRVRSRQVVVPIPACAEDARAHRAGRARAAARVGGEEGGAATRCRRRFLFFALERRRACTRRGQRCEKTMRAPRGSRPRRAFSNPPRSAFHQPGTRASRQRFEPLQAPAPARVWRRRGHQLARVQRRHGRVSHLRVRRHRRRARRFWRIRGAAGGCGATYHSSRSSAATRAVQPAAACSMSVRDRARPEPRQVPGSRRDARRVRPDPHPPGGAVNRRLARGRAEAQRAVGVRGEGSVRQRLHASSRVLRQPLLALLVALVGRLAVPPARLGRSF